ncbi:hypothetical protein ACFSQT_35770 [Mesorhizobium calcicola]|uniref:Uncharacterized protein n=1 Tax=Mesorhizobium calcicola TaxID=1300310 RepID=A0ABW4WRH3_9HYPH
MPQTAADHDARLKAIRLLLEKHPAVGWQIALQQFGDYGSRVGDYSHKPKWRSDGYGFGEPFKTWGPINAFVLEMVELALSRPSYTVEMLCDLIGRLHALGPDFQDRVWDIIDEWRKSGANDDEIAKVREKLRVTVLSRRGRKKADEKGHASLSKTAKAIYDAMRPTDVVNQHEWLFRQDWIDESADEFAEEEIDFEAREKRVEKLRIEALTAVAQERGLDGVFDLATKGSSQRRIGAYLANGILKKISSRTSFCGPYVRPSGETGRDSIAAGAMWAMDTDRREALYTTLRPILTEEEALRLLLLSPYRMTTWDLWISCRRRRALPIGAMLCLSTHLTRRTRTTKACAVFSKPRDPALPLRPCTSS